MEAKMFSPPHSRSLRARAPPSRPRAVSLRWLRVSATTGDGPLEEEDGGVSEGKSAAAPRAPPGTLKIRYRSISRKQARKREEEESAAAAAPPPKPPAKAWEEMTVGRRRWSCTLVRRGCSSGSTSSPTPPSSSSSEVGSSSGSSAPPSASTSSTPPPLPLFLAQRIRRRRSRGRRRERMIPFLEEENLREISALGIFVCTGRVTDRVGCPN
ncbi:unnamed protein product [Spirodela intermedia]|uniref:Uncharacterized protein n=1 Tax=Spirodela intermedia TaxID=51605 RepID=A0A7I8JUT9_SPIIN|nr:unnamed protein product [Spirodela intermedia]CAA6673491.1 unnamed protein product [Spirodela intermedia]